MGIAKGPDGLTERQRAFVKEYLIDLHITNAAKRAGYGEKSAEKTGSKILRLPHVAEEIALALEARSKKTKIGAEWLLTRLAEEAEADVNDLYDDQGRIKPVKEWPMIWRKGLVAGLEVETIGAGVGQITKVKLSDRVKRLELIGKHVNVQAFRERIEHSGIGGKPIETITVGMTPKEAAERYRDELG